MNIKTAILSCMVATAYMLSSCATIASGGDPRITINGSMVDEPVTITTEKKTYTNVSLPTTVQVKRKKLEGQTIKIESESYTFQDIELHRSNNGWIIGNILLGGVAGMGIDLLTNSVSSPSQVSYDIVPIPKNERKNVSQNEYTPAKQSSPSFEMPSDIIKLSGGLSLILSNVYLENQFENKVMRSNWRPGISALLEYEHIFKSGWGFGLNVIYNDTRYKNTYKNSAKKNLALRQVYLGPSVVRRNLIGYRWLVEGVFGIGYSHLGGDFLDGTSGLGFMLKGGVEYMLSKHVGIGVEMNDVIAITGENNDDLMKKYSEDNSWSGSFRIDFAAGIRFYF